MSHESTHSSENKSLQSAFAPSFWFVLLLAFLFVATVNFVRVMSHDEADGHGEHTTEAHHAPEAH
jgi:hypothetical protein